MNSCRCAAWVGGMLLTAGPLQAQAPDIDRLLSKLPAPETVVKTKADRRLLEARELQADPLAREMMKAIQGKDARKSLEVARSFAARYPKNTSAHFLRGSFAMFTRQHAEAKEAFRRGIQLDPKLAMLHLGLATNAALEGRMAEALPSLKRASELEPKNVSHLLAIAGCNARLGRKDECAVYARRAAVVAPGAAGVWVYLARAENARRDYPAAVRALGRAAELEPDNFLLQSGLGFSLINLKRDTEAIAPLERAYRRNNRDVLVAGQLGYCYLKSGQLDRADELLRHTTRLNARYGPAWGHLGTLQRRRGNRPEALKSFKRATEIMPQNGPVWKEYAFELRTAGRGAEAEVAERRAAALPGTAARARTW